MNHKIRLALIFSHVHWVLEKNYPLPIFKNLLIGIGIIFFFKSSLTLFKLNPTLRKTGLPTENETSETTQPFFSLFSVFYIFLSNHNNYLPLHLPIDHFFNSSGSSLKSHSLWVTLYAVLRIRIRWIRNILAFWNRIRIQGAKYKP